ncbi:hypothetical protein EDC45_0789 [Mesocricetibacter intestinalis]|uniref:Putative zinc-finger domain-containing protein n=1 Tax=Mesocricetibacter intestinalis TaxID=1521930 RepID=A0A4R6VAL9_9PAST|nr:zf-HC2 domain-containing protein [Mesocricetibacter intestinalis]TDQ58997.1 hypothetical protein EDC45_0789 [Mesocricetibacter intestinalis]
MKCAQATRAISDARERELKWSEKAGLMSHLLICPYCRGFKHNCEEMSKMMKSFAAQSKDKEQK